VEETADEGLAEAGEELDGFGGLERSDETGDGAEDAGFGAEGTVPGGGGVGNMQR
jgi:hypothetical protein